MPSTWSQTITVSAGTSTPSTLAPIPLDIFETPFNVGFGITKAGGGDVTFSVQHTLSDIYDPAVTKNWFTHADVTAATASIDGNYAYGIRAVRLALASSSGASTLTFEGVQVGSGS